MLRFKLDSTFAAFDKYVSCIRHHYGGVTSPNFALLHRQSTHNLRESETNLNNSSHVHRVPSSNSNLNLAYHRTMPKNRVRYVTTGQVWSFHDLLGQLAQDHNLANNETVQFVEVQKVLRSAKKKKEKKKISSNNGTAFMTSKVLTQQQIAQYSTISNKPAEGVNSVLTETILSETQLRGRNSPAKDDKNILKIFPQPKYSMNHVYITLAKHFADNSYQVSPKFKSIKQKSPQNLWECTYSVKWPTSLQFTAIASTKQDASHKACMEGLKYLYSNKHITNKNLPIIPGQEEEAKRERARIDPLVLKREVIDAMQGIVQDYEEKMLQHLQVESSTDAETSREALETSEEVWPVYQEQRTPKFRGLEFYTCREGKILPISEFK